MAPYKAVDPQQVLPDDEEFFSERLHGVGDRPDDYRSRYQRDVDRILYSSAFRRLTGVTQVVSADETLLFHNRLTHTLKVAQIAKRLGQKILTNAPDLVGGADGLSPDAVEAAALAHDLGHPPFGHIAEEVLRELCDAHGVKEVDVNGYEGNAQTFRIVTKLSIGSGTRGLNLTRRTLRGVLKYPWLRTGDNAGASKWGAYDSETTDFQWAVQDRAGRSLEAQIMDWADDITYAVHDLEDFYRAGLTPIARLMSHEGGPERERFVLKAGLALQKYPEFDADVARDAFGSILETISLDSPYEGSNRDRRRIHESASYLITRFVDGTQLAPNGRDLSLPPGIWHEVNMLKQLTWQYVINSPDLATIQEGQKAIIRDLFEYLVDWAEKEGGANPERLPTRFREILKSVKADNEAMTVFEGDEARVRARATADYVASLTEAQAFELHGRLRGASRSSVLHAWARA